MIQHHQSLKVIDGVIALTCTCGYQEILGWKCTTGLVYALSTAHMVAVTPSELTKEKV